MKKAMKKFKQTLSILLAVAMVITMIPATPVSAAELNTVEQETSVESEETTGVTSTEEADTPAETEQETTSAEEENAPAADEATGDETTGETTDKVVEEASEETTETTEEAVVEEAPVEEDLIEEIVEGEADGVETYSIGGGQSDITGTFELTNNAEATITITSPETDENNYVWSEEDSTLTVKSGAEALDELSFMLSELTGFRVDSVTLTVTDNDETSIVATEDENVPGAYTIDTSDTEITSDFKVTINTVATHDVTATWNDSNIASVTRTDGEAQTSVTSGEAFKVDADQSVNFTVTVTDAVKDTMKVKAGDTDATKDSAAGVYTYELVAAQTAVTFTTAPITYTVTKPNDETKATVAVDDSKTEANAGDALGFTVTATDGNKIKSVTYTMDGSDPVTFAGDTLTSDGKYTIPKVTGNVTISVTTAALYTVTKGTDNADLITIHTALEDGKVEENTPISFTVAEPDATTNKEVTKVSYSVGGSEQTPALGKTGGSYTIPAEKVTGDIVISVTTEDKITEAVITFEEANDITYYEADGTTEIEDDKKVPTKQPFTFVVKAGENKKVSTVTAAEGNDNTSLTVTEAAGKYTITPRKATVTVTAAARDIKNDLTATFDFEATQADVAVTSQGHSLSDKTVSNITEDTELTFTVAPKTVYKLVSVKAGADKATATEVPKTGDAYTLTVTDNVSIYIETALDTEESPSLDFSVSSNDLSKSFTAKLAQPTTDSSDFVEDIDTDTEYTADSDTIYTANTKLNVVLTIKDGYQLDKVMSGTTPLTLPTPSGSEYTFEDVPIAKGTNLIVHTSAKANEQEKTVTFEAEALDNLTYTVATEEGKVEAVKDTNDYKVTTKAEYFSFSIRTPNADAYTPDVTTDNTEFDLFVTSQEKAEDGSVTYTYKIPAVLLSESGTTVTIEEVVADKTVAVTYDSTEVEKVTATEGNVDVSEDTDGTTIYAGTTATTSFTVPYGTKLNVAVYAKENCEITGAVTKPTGAAADAEGTTHKVKPNGFRFDITATENTVTTVASKGLYTTRLSTAGTADTAIAPVKGAYSVEPAAYIAEVFYGANTPVAPSTAKAEVIGTTTEEGKQPTTVTVAGNKATINVSRDDAGKALEVKLYKDVPATEEAEATTAELATFKLNVTPDFNKVTVTGVNGGVLKQTLDTKHTYAIKLDPAAANINDLAVYVDNQTVAAAEIDAEAKELVVTTLPGKAADAKADAAIIKIYDATVKDNDKAETAKALAGGTIKVTTLASAMHGDKAKPVVKTVSATDTSVTLSFAAPKNTELPETGKLYYRVSLKAAAPADDKVKAPEKLVTTEIKEDIAVTKDTGLTVEKTFKVFTDDVIEGNGAKWDFDVAVTMVQTTDGKAIAEANTAFTSATVPAKTATKDPYLETKLSLKKGTTTVYTGQENVTVATPIFNKLTSYSRITAAEVISVGGYGDAVTVDESKLAENKIVINTDGDTAVGKHTIKVTAFSPDEMYKSTATVVVTVVRGIESIDLVSPSDKLYKADKKAGSLKLTAELNRDSADPAAPKTKKVTWEIYEGDTVKPERLIDKNHALSKLITVKNGTVSVNKSYEVKALDGDAYTVVARAADFAGNEAKTFDAYTITVTDQMTELGGIAILRWNNQTSKFDVFTRGNAQVEPSDLSNMHLCVFRKGAPQKESYTTDELSKWAVDLSWLTVKASNKALTVNEDGEICYTAAKPAKNISITATTNDGGKQSVKLEKLSIGYAAVAELGLNVYRIPDNKSKEMYDTYSMDLVEDTNTKAISYQGTKDTNFVLNVVYKADAAQKDWYEGIPELTNYKLSVSGGKILYGQAERGLYQIQPTAAVTTVTLKNNADKTEQKYVLTNKAFSKDAAPKVKTTDKLYAGFYKKAQTITYQLSGNYDWTNKYVLVNTDSAARMTKLGVIDYKYRGLEQQGNVNGIIPINPDGSFSLKFDEKDDDGNNLDRTNIAANSYKLSFSFGTVDKKTNELVADTKAVAVTLKAAAQVKASYKLTTKYTLSPAEGYKAELKGTAKGDADAIFYAKDNTNRDGNYGLLNANIKGQENKFRTYFNIEEDKLVLAPTLTKEQIEAISKDDLTGYVCYDVIFYGNTMVPRTEKITVTIEKESKGYAVTSATAYQKADKSVEATVAVTKAKAAVPTAYALAVTEGDVFTAAVVQEGVANTSNILLKAAKAEKGSYPITLYVVPEDSYYKETIQKAAPDKQKEAIQTYGVELKTTIRVEEPVDPTKQANVIKLANKENAKTFTAADYAGGSYKTSSAFTQKTQDKVATCTIAVAADEKKPSIITIDSIEQLTNGTGRIKASVSKAAIVSYLEHADTPVKYEDTIKTVVTVTFASGNKQELPISYKLPKEAQTFEAATNVVASADYNTVITDCINKTEDTIVAEIAERVNNVVAALEAAGKIKPDSDMIYKDVDVSVNEQPSDSKDGAALAEIAMVNAVDQSVAVKYVKFTLLYGGAAPTDYEDKLEEFVTDGMTFDTNAEATRTAVITAALEALDLPDNLRLSLSGWEKVNATMHAEGKIKGTLTIHDIKYGNDSVSVDMFEAGQNEWEWSSTFTIRKLDDLSETAAKIKSAVESAPANGFTNFTTKEDVKKAIDAAIVNKTITAAWQQIPDATEGAAEGAKKDNFTFTTKASESSAGKIDAAVVLTDADGKTSTVTLEIAVAIHDSKDTVKSAVQTALSADALSKIALANIGADAQKAAVLAAAQEAIATNPYKAELAAEPAFAMQAPTYKAAGSATFTVNLMTIPATAEAQPTLADKVEINNLALPVSNDYITAAEAAELVTEALKADGTFGQSVTNATDLEAVVSAAKVAVQSYDTISVEAKITGEGAEAKEDFTKKEATFAADGSIAGTLVIKKTVPAAAPETAPTVTTEEATYSYVLAKLNTVDKAVTAVKNAVVAMEWTTATAEINADTLKAKEDAIVKLANEVIADGFNATVKENAKLTVSKAPTVTTDGTATITLVVNAAGATDAAGAQDAACTVGIVLTQTLKQAKAEAVKAVPTTLASSVTDASGAEDAVEAEVEKVIKADYTMAWGDSALTDGVFTGTLYIIEENGNDFVRAEAVPVSLPVQQGP